MATTTSPSAPVDESVDPAPVAQQAQPAIDPVPTAASNGFSITALVLGITGIVLGQGLVSVAAVVFGFVARAKEPGARTMANWGLVLGFVGVFGGLVIALLGLAAFAPFALWGAFGPWDLWDL